MCSSHSCPILLAAAIFGWRRAGQGHCHFAALVVDFFVFVAERVQELGFLVVTWSLIIVPPFSSYAAPTLHQNSLARVLECSLLFSSLKTKQLHGC